MNWQLFDRRRILHSSIPDGLSNTIAIAEEYAMFPGGTVSGGGPGVMYRSYSLAFWTMSLGDVAAFAVPALVIPVTTGTPPTSIGNDKKNPGITFQLRPSFEKCNSRLAQTGHPGGMTVGFLDGSVRRYRPTIDPHVYWGSITPDRGEIIVFD
jgi:prepilin-type processing-associated H-X9-DG protein